ncbi:MULTISPECIES: poly(glycerol-phosphate) alpha-glucosyltransferase [unclassified Listeria]|uniref:poly(glycerol-phosphate) alpha-glucosyltransferase n=1 Tax=unclassified Listeria TaxID=2642072 RepID=UPI000B58B28C|nr:MULTISPECIES: poly(glycerol-phosphate) alpha-glucosyltransferase [unclassified Listeria]
MPFETAFKKIENSAMETLLSKDNMTYEMKWNGFLSLGYENKRAKVINISRMSLRSLMDDILRALKKNQTDDLVSFKVDVAFNYEDFPLHVWNKDVLETKKNYYRKGICFDKKFEQALLEQELNGNAVLKAGKEDVCLNLENLNRYLIQAGKHGKPLQLNGYTNVTTFSTYSWFFDGKDVFTLHTDELAHGVREEQLTEQRVKQIVENAGIYLAKQVKKTGEFHYGYFACFDKTIKHYNTLRHASTTYSMLEAYEVSGNQTILAAAIRALTYLKQNFILEKEDFAYVTEPELREIKLGANAAALLAFSKYMTLTKNHEDLPLAEKLAWGILRLQEQDGSFTHVLHAPTMEVKDPFRIIYYEGEAVLGLLRLYGVSKNEAYLRGAESAFQNFIAKNYWRNHDHWLSYAANEIATYIPDEKYVLFGMQNAFDNLDFIYHRETTFPTFLELTLAAHELYGKLEMNRPLESVFSKERLREVIQKRADYQLNGLFYPEVAMYFKNPARITDSFFIRHHSFRVRIDDVEHNISGYAKFYALICQENGEKITL